MDTKIALANNASWIKSKTDKDPDYFKNLAKGQSPKILYIGCSDSRVTAEQLMGAEPGDIFVMRNVANMVINTDLSGAAIINYAVEHLGVEQIVVCGHYECGGVKAGMGSTDLGILNPYLREVRDVYRLHKQELNAISDEDERYRRLVQLNVQEQCVNLIKMVEVQKARKERGLELHGMVFDLHTGKLVDLEIDFDKELEELMDIYAQG